MYNLHMENINWLGHASFFFTDKISGNKIYFIDPFQLEGKKLKKADLIFITHAHADHFSQDDIARIIKDDTIVIAPPDILENLSIEQERKLPVSPNQKYNIKDFSFETVPAYNKKKERLNFHPKVNNWVGYVFRINNMKIYHAGDTDFIEEMKGLKNLKLDYALLPIGGTYTMDFEEASDCANAIEAKITIPMHYKNLNQGQHREIEEKFKNLVTNSKVVILEEFI